MSNREPKSQHLSDPFTQPFLLPTFDPVDYLNTTLSPLTFPSSNPTKPSSRTASFTSLSTNLQTLLNQLNANTTRLSSTLTQLTDEILRSGSRLAYEVELLRGETLSLSDALSTKLKPDIDLLSGTNPTPASIPSSLPTTSSTPLPPSEPNPENPSPTHPSSSDNLPTTSEPPTSSSPSSDPDFLSRLRTLTTVRDRLDAVIKVFGAAMAWPIAASELSLASSFISVSAPTSGGSGGGGAGGPSEEERAKAFAEEMRKDVMALLAEGAEGVEAAGEKVAEMRAVADVWKGTAEEKARGRFVEGLQRLVDERAKASARMGVGRVPQTAAAPARTGDGRYGNGGGGGDVSKLAGESGAGGYGFLKNLRNLKNDVYLD